MKNGKRRRPSNVLTIQSNPVLNGINPLIMIDSHKIYLLKTIIVCEKFILKRTVKSYNSCKL